MDPTTCLQNLLDNIATGDSEEAQGNCVDLLTWLGQGGFMPDLTKIHIPEPTNFTYRGGHSPEEAE